MAAKLGPDTILCAAGCFSPSTGPDRRLSGGYNVQLPNNLDWARRSGLVPSTMISAACAGPLQHQLRLHCHGRGVRIRIRNAAALNGGVAWAGPASTVRCRGSVLSERGIPIGWPPSWVDMRRRTWSAKLEYGYIDLGARTHGLADVPLPDVTVDPKIHTVTLGLNYKIWDGPGSVTSGDYAIKPPAPPASRDWNVHAQTTFISQGYPSFRSPYQGTNSGPPAGAARDWTASLSRMAIMGRRESILVRRCEVSDRGTLGLGGFSRRKRKKRRRVPRLPRTALFVTADFGRGAQESGRCGQSVAGQTRHRPGHGKCRTICGR